MDESTYQEEAGGAPGERRRALQGNVAHLAALRAQSGECRLRVRGVLVHEGGAITLIQGGLPGGPLVIGELQEYDAAPDVDDDSVAGRIGLSQSNFDFIFPYSQTAAPPRQLSVLVHFADGRASALVLPLPLAGEALENAPIECPTIFDEADRRLCAAAYAAFETSQGQLALACSSDPLVSIIVLPCEGEGLYACLRGLEPLHLRSCEVLAPAVDERLAARVRGVRSYRVNPELPLPAVLSNAAKEARGHYLLFLSADLQLLPGAVESALRVLEERPEAGALTGRILRPDGLLEDAGLMLSVDGRVSAFGGGKDPLRWEYLFRREIDCTSPVFTLARRDLVLAGICDSGLKGWAPALFEFCAALWERGSTVLYHPDSIAILRRSSALCDLGAAAVEMSEVLVRHPQCIVRKQAARDPRTARALPSVLLVTSELSAEGLRSDRVARLAHYLAERGFSLSLFPIKGISCGGEVVRRILPDSLECCDPRGEGIAEFLEQRQERYDLVVVWQLPHLRRVLDAVRSASTRVVCDVAGREVFSESERALLRKVSSVLVEQEHEAHCLRAVGITHAVVLPLAAHSSVADASLMGLFEMAA